MKEVTELSTKLVVKVLTELLMYRLALLEYITGRHPAN